MTAISKLAQDKRDADKAYETAFTVYLQKFKPMEVNLFWEMIDVFRDEIKSRMEYGTAVGDASHNMFCKFVYRSYVDSDVGVWPEEEMGRWEQMARFLARYSEVSRDLYKRLIKMPGIGHGDDSYGDLIDSLPLAGRKICSDIMEDNIANDKQLVASFDGPGMDPPDKLRDFILRGENYIKTTFDEALSNSFVSVALRDDEPEEEVRKDPHVVLVQKAVKKEGPWGRCTEMVTRVRGPFLNSDEAEAYVKQEGEGTAVKIHRGIVKQ